MTYRIFHSEGIALLDDNGFPIELLSLASACTVARAFRSLNPNWTNWKIVDSIGNTLFMV